MNIIADTHVHTIASEHAFSTLTENLNEAKARGLRFLAVTDHAGKMPGAPSDTYFFALPGSMPQEYNGVYIVRGCEVNILDEKGTLDLSDLLLSRLEWVIASIHGLLTPSMSVEQSTELWLNVAKNPHVDVIGHCGEAAFAFDYERVIPEFASNGKIVEINANSYRSRPTSVQNCIEIARLCAKYEVPLVLSSDAHFAADVGNVAGAIHIVREANVPERLILNADSERFAAFLSRKTGRRFEL